MFLEIHDNEPPTLCGVARNIDYMYQAEQWVIDSCKTDNERDSPGNGKRQVFVLWLLFTDDGKAVRAWKRVGDSFEDTPVPAGTICDPRSLRPKARVQA